MEENKDDDLAIFHKRKRKRRKIILAILTTIFLIAALILISSYYILNLKSSIRYNENSNVNYRVNLIENEFYKTDYLEGNVAVISNLIKNIDVEFRYNLNVAEEIEYTYNYKIISNTQLKEKSKTNLLYSNEQVTINKPSMEGKAKRIEIVEKFNINYNDYNNQVNKLIKEFKLDNTASEVSFIMYLNVTNKATGKRINQQNNVMAITIPLDTKTVEITVNENAQDNQGEIIIEETQNENSKIYLILGIITLLIGLSTLVSLIIYKSKTRSAEKMYEDEMKKILFDYKSYIQKINTQIDYKSYKIIKIDTFEELMNMREEVQAPILMYTEKNNLKTIFMMIKDDILFAHALSAKAIRNNLIEESKKRKKGKEEKNEKNK